MAEELAQTKRENARLLRKLEHADPIRLDAADYDTQVALAEANVIRHAVKQDSQLPEAIEPSAERAAQFLNAVRGIEIVDGYELQPEEQDIETARREAVALDDALSKLRFGWRLVRTRRDTAVTR